MCRKISHSAKARLKVVSVIVYERVRLRILRRGWFNLDLGRSLVLIGSGAITLFTA